MWHALASMAVVFVFALMLFAVYEGIFGKHRRFGEFDVDWEDLFPDDSEGEA